MTSSCRVRHHKTYNLPICFIIHWLSLLATTTTTLTTTSTAVTALLSSANSIVNDATTEKRYRCLSVLQHQPISDKPVSSQPQQPFLFLFNIHLCLCVDSSVLGWAFNARPHSHKLNELAGQQLREISDKMWSLHGCCDHLSSDGGHSALLHRSYESRYCTATLIFLATLLMRSQPPSSLPSIYFN